MQVSLNTNYALLNTKKKEAGSLNTNYALLNTKKKKQVV